MSSSTYWLNRKRELEGKKDRFNKILDNIGILDINVSIFPSELRDSETYFKDGGYNDGDTLDRGVLKECYTSLDSVVEVLGTLKEDTKVLIDDLDIEIETAKNNYNYYLRKEQEEK